MAYMCQYSNKECDCCGKCMEHEDSEPIFVCCECRTGIFEDEGYYEIEGFYYCDDCMSKHWHTA